MNYDKLKERWRVERATRRQQAAERKHALQTRGLPVFKKFGIQKAVVFGSVTAHSSRVESDIDLLVMPLAAEHYWAFRHELEQALEYPLDLYTQDDDPGFVKKILARGDTVYDVQS
jgi:predicted nucleotidyltransferase